ncbi:hypothetical protein AVEN_158183-1 [Araneus ventricosus]|uniref:Uncharacterized protein n=1 Tax=Araneus ventricosus TaxID=182803 RepID=A0A4Y2G7D7_ARAVE|nr:hypothetical protein AVEN_158183-1 [Araneus ventricosus]
MFAALGTGTREVSDPDIHFSRVKLRFGVSRTDPDLGPELAEVHLNFVKRIGLSNVLQYLFICRLTLELGPDLAEVHLNSENRTEFSSRMQS